MAKNVENPLNIGFPTLFCHFFMSTDDVNEDTKNEKGRISVNTEAHHQDRISKNYSSLTYFR